VVTYYDSSMPDIGILVVVARECNHPTTFFLMEEGDFFHGFFAVHFFLYFDFFS
jgi:hypothetical protein